LKRIILTVLCLAFVFVGCSKPSVPKNNGATQTPAPSAKAQESKTQASPAKEAKAQDAKTPNSKNQNKYSMEEFEKLNKELEKTTDENKRKEILAKIQKILEQVEQNQ